MNDIQPNKSLYTDMPSKLIAPGLSLEYIQRARPEVSGIAKRVEDIERARAVIAKAGGEQP